MITDIIQGLQIIDKYRPEKVSPYHVRAEHDEIIAGNLAWPISDEDRDILENKLGWTPIEDYDGWRYLL